ncbi:Group II intron-encoded protein LtrA [Lactococcus lactis]|nr:Group II intron-encoded protein LtrA [Lactococcus lactis]
MKPTMAILERISKNSQENIDEVFTRLYRYLLRPDIITWRIKIYIPIKELPQKEY